MYNEIEAMLYVNVHLYTGVTNNYENKYINNRRNIYKS